MLDDAIHQYELTLQAQERALGSGHLDTLGTRNILAGTYREAGRSRDAVAQLKLARAGCVRVLGDEHPLTVTVRKNLKRARREAGAR